MKVFTGVYRSCRDSGQFQSQIRFLTRMSNFLWDNSLICAKLLFNSEQNRAEQQLPLMLNIVIGYWKKQACFLCPTPQMGTDYSCRYSGLSALKKVPVVTIPKLLLLNSKRNRNEAMCHTAEPERQYFFRKAVFSHVTCQR